MFSSTKCLWITLLQVLYYSQTSLAIPVPPADIGTNYQINKNGMGIIGPYSNKSIDQLITGALGGVGKAASNIVGANGSILAELDMMLNFEQFNELYEVPETEAEPIRKKRKAARNEKFRWTNGVIPYEIDPYDFSTKDLYFIQRALTEWERYTCLKFVPATSRHTNRVLFRHGNGCNSQLGMVGGIQDLNLDANGCRYKGLYLHEVGHAIGLVHEHQLPDRDKHINIIYRNVLPSMRIWFNKYSSSVVNTMNVPYELSSVMHYGITAFSYDGQSQTIAAKDKSREDEIGKVWQKELSHSDVEAVNFMYNCKARCPEEKRVKCLNGGFLDENCKCICPDGSNDCQEGATTDSTCVNKYRGWPCAIWANQGECERNPTFMDEYCIKACNRCGQKEDLKKYLNEENFAKQLFLWLGFETQLTPEEWNGSGGCKNVYSDIKCNTWIENGDCLTNPTWMNKNCQKSCSMCSKVIPGTSCENSYSNPGKCEQWALEGECKLNAAWMEKRCAKSCRTCDKSVTTGGGTDENEKCEDSVDYRDKCPAWAAGNQCAINPLFMVEHCRKSCNKCQTRGCMNLYKDSICNLKALDGKCERDKAYMRANCRKACKLCTQEEIDYDKKTTVYVEPTTAPTTKSSPENCYDSHTSVQDCKMWHDNNHCKINPDWMGKYCRKSCGLCRDRGTTTSSNSCVDTASKCVEWAKHNMCSSNARYMLIHCKKSCGACGSCEDDNQLCSAWAKGEHCTKNPGYMLRHCRKSCNAC